MPQERDFLRTDATAEHQQALDFHLGTAFPQISSVEGLSAYRAKQTTYASFQLEQNPLLPQIFQTALLRAEDPCDAAFSTHAGRHGNFTEVTGDLITALRAGELRIRKSHNLLSLNTEKGDIQVSISRLVLDGARRKRTTYRPAPLQLFLELENKIGTLLLPEEKYSLFARVIRKAAGAYGVPFAILTCLYAGVTAKPIIDLFNNKDIRRNILEEREKAGVKKVKIPSTNPDDHTALHYMILDIRDLLVTANEDGTTKPRYHPGDYLEALRRFDRRYKSDFSPELTEFVPSDDFVIPKAVFAGLDEIAQRAASAEFLDPYRRHYIDRICEGRYTTQMVTAYFDSHIDRERLHFTRLFNFKNS